MDLIFSILNAMKNEIYYTVSIIVIIEEKTTSKRQQK